MWRYLSAVVVVGSVAGAASAGTVIFDNKGDFENFNGSEGKVFKGLDDFEEANVGRGDVAGPLSDPLEGNVENLDGAGLGFPDGLTEKNLVIQSNSLGANAANTSPGGGLAAIGPDTFFAGVPNSAIVTTALAGESLDLIFTEPNHTGVGFDITGFGGSTEAVITVFDPSNQQLAKQTIAVTQDQKAFFGVWSGDSIGRINVAAVNPPGHAFVDNVQMWQEGPCVGDLDNDGTVGILDFLELLGNWGPCP